MKVFTGRLPGRTDREDGTDRVRGRAEEAALARWAKAAGAAALVSATSSLTAVGLLYGRGPVEARSSLLTAFLALAVVAALIAALLVGLVARRAPLGASEIPRHLSRAWREAGGWTMFFFGCALGLPAFALYTPALTGDADSARIVASVLYVQRNGLDYLVQTQEVLLPHILLGPILALGGIRGVQLFDVLSVVALGGVVALIVWRISRSPLMVLAGVLALSSLTALLDRAYRVPMYPTMLALGFLGVYLSHRAMVAETRSHKWRNSALAGLCLVLAFEAHQVGQLFLVLTALLIVTAGALPALAGLGRVFLVVVVLSIPRLVINLAEGGFSHLLSNRVDYWVTEGYLRPIQADVFYLPVRAGLGEYLKQAPGGLLGAWGFQGALTLLLGLVGLLAMSGRLRRFALVCTGFILAVALYRRLPFYTRYFSMLLVGSALSAGLAFGLLRQDSRARRAAVGLGLLGLFASAVVSYGATIEKLQRLEHTVASGPYLRFAKEMSPGDGVIGARSVSLNFVSTDVRTFGGQFLTEQEYVTFLTWPSDRAVIDLMRRHDIEWIFVPSQPWKWVARYNDIWLLPKHGRPARYHREVKQSPAFCRARKIEGASLYKLDPLGAADGVGARGVRRCELQ